MLQVRRGAERGHADHGWLDSRHTFSFGDYHDPRHIGFGTLCVINEDRVQPGAGFGTHGHKNMEILSYVLAGALVHKDSLGNESVMRPGDVQRLCAGTGIQHSEFNHSNTEPVHFLQMWIVPAQKGLRPNYEQRHFDDAALRGQLRLVASPDGRDGSVTIHQDASLYAVRLDPGNTVSHRLAATRKAYVHIARGRVELNGEPLSAGDGVTAETAEEIAIVAREPAEVLLFDLG